MTKEQTMRSDDTRVSERAERRTLTVAYKTAIVQEAEACRAPGEIGSLLRREGLYSSHLTTWRKLYHAGARQALSTRRGPNATPTTTAAFTALQRENVRLRAELAQVALVLEIQKQVSTLLAAHSLAPSGEAS